MTHSLKRYENVNKQFRAHNGTQHTSIEMKCFHCLLIEKERDDRNAHIFPNEFNDIHTLVVHTRTPSRTHSPHIGISFTSYNGFTTIDIGVMIIVFAFFLFEFLSCTSICLATAKFHNQHVIDDGVDDARKLLQIEI